MGPNCLPRERPRLGLFAKFIDKPANNTVLTKKLNMRGGPGENYSVLGTLEHGASVNVIRTKGEWLEIEPPANAYAFVAAMYLSQTAPAPQPAPAQQPAAAPAGPAQPVDRVVAHEGVVGEVLSPVAPTAYKLYDPTTYQTIDYLYTTAPDLDLSRYVNMRIIVTGVEGIDPRWKDSPLIAIQSIQVVSQMPSYTTTSAAPDNVKIIDGRAIAAQIQRELGGRIAALKVRGVAPGLAFVRVGEDPASRVYVGRKEKACAELGIFSETHVLPEPTLESDLLALLEKLNVDARLHGILVQAPLPKQIRESVVYSAVRPQKDVDGFHPVNVGKLMLGDATGFQPCTPAGVRELLVRSQVNLGGAEVVVLGRGNIVGKPMAAMLCQKGKHANATVTLCHSATRDIAAHCRRADILIAAMGVAEFVKADMVKPGATVIDVGVNRVSDPAATSGSRLVGDVDFAGVQTVAGKITPNPGGVGPMTIAMLMQNTVRAAEMNW